MAWKPAGENGKKKVKRVSEWEKVGVWVSWYDNGVIGQKGTYQDDQKWCMD